MSKIVRDYGFDQNSLREEDFISLEALRKGVENPVRLDLNNDENPDELQPFFCWLELIRIPFPDFNDGRGFSMAKRLRQLGYQGVLRAQGYLIADQYRMARLSGFDEIEIDDLLAVRQPEWLWRNQVLKKNLSYQDRLLKTG